MNSFIIVLSSLVSFLLFKLYVAPRLNPLSNVGGPPIRRFLGSHLSVLLEYVAFEFVCVIFIVVKSSQLSKSA